MNAFCSLILCLLTTGVALGAESAKVLILPFEPVGQTKGYEWIGQGMRQNLLAELSQVEMLHPTAATTRPVGQTDAAIQQAKDAHAPFVILGSYQMNGDQVRITGEVIDVITGRTIGGLSATGTLRDLFSLEDDVAAQATRILSSRIIAAHSPAPNGNAAAPPNVANGNGPLRFANAVDFYSGSDLQQAVRRGRVDLPQYPNYADRYTYGQLPYSPYYPYAYGGWGYPGPIFVFSRFHHRRHHHLVFGGFFAGPVILGLTPSNVVLTHRVGGGFDGIPAGGFDYSQARGHVAGYVPHTMGPTGR